MKSYKSDIQLHTPEEIGLLVDRTINDLITSPCGQKDIELAQAVFHGCDAMLASIHSDTTGMIRRPSTRNATTGHTGPRGGILSYQQQRQIMKDAQLEKRH